MLISKQTPLEKIIKLGKECKKCGHCCSFGSGFLIEKDIKRIARFLDITEKFLKRAYLDKFEKFHTTLYRPRIIKADKPYGKCIFLHNKHCVIHKVKPMQCKIVNCGLNSDDLRAWFDLNYFLNLKDPESIRDYAFYLKHGGKTIPGGKLHELMPKERLDKILSMEIMV